MRGFPVLPDTQYVLSCNAHRISESAQAIFQSLTQDYTPWSSEPALTPEGGDNSPHFLSGISNTDHKKLVTNCKCKNEPLRSELCLAVLFFLILQGFLIFYCFICMFISWLHSMWRSLPDFSLHFQYFMLMLKNRLDCCCFIGLINKTVSQIKKIPLLRGRNRG
ncbi:DNA-binding transcriptional repressor LrhA [Raoultella planticola]|uniref:DNA-binding transcriptional repressor LrhA n=1 Tax=Raoultella planticola TaxID=575 RepID=A0A485C4M1_RAOPL|nr:DNA-binding transcriptional repressor LrhA [Raoultella planticola]